MSLQQQLEKTLDFLPANFRANLVNSIVKAARVGMEDTISELIDKAQPATIKRMKDDGWDPVGTRDQHRHPSPEPAQAVRDAIRTASYFLAEYAVKEHYSAAGANIPAEIIRGAEDTAVLDAVTPQVNVGLPVASLVPLVAKALSDSLGAGG